MLVPICLCTFIGIFLDRRLGTSFLVIIFFFMGALAGFRNVYFFAKKIYSQENERDRIRDKYKDDLGKTKKD